MQTFTCLVLNRIFETLATLIKSKKPLVKPSQISLAFPFQSQREVHRKAADVNGKTRLYDFQLDMKHQQNKT